MSTPVPADSQPAKSVNRTPAKTQAAPKKAATRKPAEKKPNPLSATVDKKPGLLTGWATSEVPPNFDHDQSAVHEWAIADPKDAEETLITQMTIADAEELIFTSQKIAREHRDRAHDADRLAERIAKRLGRTLEQSKPAKVEEPETIEAYQPEQGVTAEHMVHSDGTMTSRPRSVLTEKTVRLQAIPDDKAPTTRPIPAGNPGNIPAFLTQPEAAAGSKK